MTVGLVPLIPLYRVQANPEARFQRFGINDSQLFGKPMVQVTAQEHQPAQPPRVDHRSASSLQSQDQIETRAMTGQEQSRSIQEAYPYTQGAGAKPTSARSPKVGSQLDVKA